MSLAAPVVCVECAVTRQVKAPQPIEIARISKEQIEEVRAAGVDATRAELNRAVTDFFKAEIAKHRERS